ncbi:MAG: hypothetical protein ACOCTS_03950 [Thermodesulfobacteriota bacterium]
MSVEQIENALQAAAEDGDLSCAAAFEAAAAYDLPPEEVGDLADRLGLHLCRCQLGLFGYPPHKKIVTPLEHVDKDLADAIRAGLEAGRLPCRTAWEIADQRGIPRMQVSAACETLEVKIKPCQLGAF